MKIKLLVALAFLGLSAPAFAQVSDSSETKHQIGIMASPSLYKLFRDNRSLPVGLIYKRQVKANQFWRLSTVGSYHNQVAPDQRTDNKITNFKSTEISWTSHLGYEWQEQLNKRFVFYYGVDAGVGLFNHDKDIDQRINILNDNGELIERHLISAYSQRVINYQLKPMIGFQFKIHNKLYIGTESNIILRHVRAKDTNFNTLT